ncbi:hypothetical protein BaRGS_00005962 [Batillaria attramentaria]|uniref:Uncharacterized protein n=1 Tax=Batillaria attramentaria TaxID=370345 RepID=A0ABD0LTB8_9CAEN
MESNIVQDFQNLRVFSNRNINRMDELVQDLTNALEETSKVSRSGGNQENGISSGTVGRRQHKRRRGTRRAAVNIYWKRGTISEASESSIDEAIRDYIDNSVVTHSDSDDLALTHPKHRLMVPMSEPIPAVESDSFTENLSPLRPQRRRRRYKHMAVDSLQSLGQLDISAANENSNSSGSRTCTVASPIAVPATTSHAPETRQVIRQQSVNTVTAASSHPSSAAGVSRTSGQNVVPGKRKRSSKSRSEGVTSGTRKTATSDKDSIDLDSMEVASTSQ